MSGRLPHHLLKPFWPLENTQFIKLDYYTHLSTNKNKKGLIHSFHNASLPFYKQYLSTTCWRTIEYKYHIKNVNKCNKNVSTSYHNLIQAHIKYIPTKENIKPAVRQPLQHTNMYIPAKLVNFHNN